MDNLELPPEGLMKLAKRVLFLQALKVSKNRAHASRLLGVCGRTMYAFAQEQGIGRSKADRQRGPSQEDLNVLRSFLFTDEGPAAAEEPQEDAPVVTTYERCWKCGAAVEVINGIQPEFCPECDRPTAVTPPR